MILNSVVPGLCGMGMISSAVLLRFVSHRAIIMPAEYAVMVTGTRRGRAIAKTRLRHLEAKFDVTIVEQTPKCQGLPLMENPAEQAAVQLRFFEQNRLK